MAASGSFDLDQLARQAGVLAFGPGADHEDPGEIAPPLGIQSVTLGPRVQYDLRDQRPDRRRGLLGEVWVS